MSRAATRLQHLVSIESGARTEFYDTEVEHAISIGGEHIQNGRFHLNENLRIVPIDFYKKRKTGWVLPGDTLLVKDGATIGKSMYVSCMPKRAMMVNEHVFVLRPCRIENRFLSFLIQSQTVQDTIWSLNVAAAQPGLSRDFAKHVYVAVTKREHQRAIADYLDTETGRIDALVEKKQRLVDLLNERRQAIITQAVTKGLDHGVAMRDSGIEWLGEIPAHWEVKRLKHVGSAKIGLTYSPANIVDENDGMIVLRASNIQNGKIVYEDNVFVNSKIPSQLILHKGDVLICSRSGSRDLIGKNAMIDCDSEGVTFGAFMTAFRSEHNDYIYRVFNSALFQYHVGAFGTSTVNQITLDILLDLKIPFPPLPEQRAIAEYLDAETARIDTLVSKLQRQIELLTERRQAVITAAVTGKLDVKDGSFIKEKPQNL